MTNQSSRDPCPGPQTASPADQEDFFTASESSRGSTPSFQTALDRMSVLSCKSFQSEGNNTARCLVHTRDIPIELEENIFGMSPFQSFHTKKMPSRSEVDKSGMSSRYSITPDVKVGFVCCGRGSAPKTSTGQKDTTLTHSNPLYGV